MVNNDDDHLESEKRKPSRNNNVKFSCINSPLHIIRTISGGFSATARLLQVSNKLKREQ